MYESFCAISANHIDREQIIIGHNAILPLVCYNGIHTPANMHAFLNRLHIARSSLT